MALDTGVSEGLLKEAYKLMMDSILKTVKEEVNRKHIYIYVPVPKELWPKWEIACHAHGISSHMLMRSIVHHYLQGSWEPPYFDRWRVDGKAVKTMELVFHHYNYEKWPEAICMGITRAAHQALSIRAKQRDMTFASLTRAIALAAMDGSWAQPGSIEIVNTRNMFYDVDRYHLKRVR